MQEIKRKEAERIGKKIGAKLGPEAETQYLKRMYEGPGRLGGGARGAGTGAVTGATIGTMMLPGIGTAVGAGIGAVVGAGTGAIYGLTRGRRARLEAKAEKYRQEAAAHWQANNAEKAQKAQARAEKAQRKANKISLLGIEEAGASQGKFDEKALQQAIEYEKRRLAQTDSDYALDLSSLETAMREKNQGQIIMYTARLKEREKGTLISQNEIKLRAIQGTRKKRGEKEKEDSLLKKLREEIDKEKPPTEKPPEETKEE